MAATISLGMIVRDASATLEQCLKSVAPHVDEIVIGLGGESTDNTEEIARKFTDKIIPIEWNDDFAEARNIVLEATTGDYFLWLDADDELIGGERMHQLTIDHPEIDAFYWGYDYSHTDEGVCVCYLIRERLIHKTRQWKWVGRIHEVLMGPENHSKILVDEIVVKHHPQPKNDFRNLEILYRELEETEPNPSPRTLIYLGTENANRGNLREALLHLQRYVALSGWDEEKYQAQHRIADLYRSLGDFQKARGADFSAISIRPDWPDAYLGLAETSFFEGNYRETIEWSKNASTKKPPQTFLIVNPRDYDFHPLVVLANAYLQLHDYEMAMENFKQAVEIQPDASVIYNLKILMKEAEGHQLVDSFLQIWRHLAQNDEWLKARQLFQSIPKLIEKTPPIQEKMRFTLASTAHVEEPQLMIDNYISNPRWEPMNEELMNSPRWRLHPRVKYALDLVKELRPHSVIDFGCSDGFIDIPLAEENPDIGVMGLDLDPRCIEVATERSQHLENIMFLQGDLQTPFDPNRKKDGLAIFFEVIEHVVDPEATLEKLEQAADHIAITTPHLAWDSPAPGWDTPELKGHLRIFDLEDIERMLGVRGRIYNLYREPFGERGWIFADYRPGERTNGHVTILAPGTPEAWSPRTFEREGLGGSETAIIGLGEGFARLGKQVSVFSRIDGEGYYNRVRYRDQQRYLPGIRSDIFVAWRAPELIDDTPNASRSILWMHDTDVGDRLTKDRAAKFTNIVVLTEWHKQHMLEVYPFLDASQLVVIPNGVDISRFDIDPPVRNPKKVVYSSSPDRGLDKILEDIWPQVTAAVPEAELHIYYGWNNFDAFIPMFPQLGEYKNKVMNLLAKSKNVVQHGRVSQTKLAEEMMSSGIWLYPTDFSETYCITAVEAQLAGLLPITNDLAALKETVVSGFVIPYSQNHGPDWYAERVVDAMTRPPEEKERQSIKNNAPAVTWNEVAEQWMENLSGISS